MYANFFNEQDECIFSVYIRTVSEGEKLADKMYTKFSIIEDWTITEHAQGDVYNF
jgi:hypothetical protein